MREVQVILRFEQFRIILKFKQSSTLKTCEIEGFPISHPTESHKYIKKNFRLTKESTWHVKFQKIDRLQRLLFFIYFRDILILLCASYIVRNNTLNTN